MGEKNATSTKKDGIYTRSPVKFAMIWLGLPLVLVVTLDLLMSHFGW
jgi:hypothetical protein